MAAKATFNATTRVITLTEVPVLENGDLVVDIDVKVDLYSDGKEDWVATEALRKVEFPLSAVGGNATVGSNKLGSTFFLASDWKIAPYESSHRLRINGNFYSVDGTSPFNTTAGTYNIFLEQTVSNLTDSTIQQLTEIQQASYAGGVAVDVINGATGTAFDFGTRKNPVDNFADMETIATANGLRRVYIMNDATISSVDLSGQNHVFIGDSPHIVLTVDPSADVTGSAMELVTVVGELNGLNTLRSCTLGAVTKVSGFIEKTAFQSTVALSGTTFMAECYSQVAGTGYPTVDVGSNTLMVRDYHGSLGIVGMTGGTHTVELYGGRLTVEASCTGGTIYMRGAHFDSVNDLSGGAVTMVDQTEAKENANAIWDEAVTDHITAGTFGEKTGKKLLTTGKFLALK